MSFKVVRDANGLVLAAGPNDDGFIPVVPAGATQFIEDEMPPPAAPSKEQRIAALLAPIGLTQAWQVDGFMAGMLGGAALQGYTEAQLLQANAAYKIAHDIREQILAIQAEP